MDMPVIQETHGVAKRRPRGGPKCGAKKRQGGEPCGQAAGWGTNHAGEGRCKLHGGNNRITHGRYSLIHRESLRDLAAHFEGDPEPLDLLPDLAQCRALYTDFINRYDVWSQALLAWQESYKAGDLPKRILAFRQALATRDPQQVLASIQELEEHLDSPREGRPRTILDVSDAHRILAEVTRIATRIEQNRSTNAISRPDFARILTEMGRSVDGVLRGLEPALGEEKVNDAIEKIRGQWATIRLA